MDYSLINRFVILAILYIILVKSKSNRNVHRIPTCEIRGLIKILQQFKLSMQNTFLYQIAFYKIFRPRNRSNKTNYFIACVMNCLYLFHVKFDFWLFEINRPILDSLWLILYISKIILFDDWCVTKMNW